MEVKHSLIFDTNVTFNETQNSIDRIINLTGFIGIILELIESYG